MMNLKDIVLGEISQDEGKRYIVNVWSLKKIFKSNS